MASLSPRTVLIEASVLIVPSVTLLFMLRGESDARVDEARMASDEERQEIVAAMLSAFKGGGSRSVHSDQIKLQKDAVSDALCDPFEQAGWESEVQSDWVPLLARSHHMGLIDSGVVPVRASTHEGS